MVCGCPDERGGQRHLRPQANAWYGRVRQQVGYGQVISLSKGVSAPRQRWIAFGASSPKVGGEIGLESQ